MDKENLVNKIASSAGIDSSYQSSQKKNDALKLASHMLKVAADNQRHLEIEIAKLSLELETYRAEKDVMTKQAMISEISSDMFEKGLIKKADIDSKNRELDTMDVKSLELLQDTISLIPEKKAEETLSNLTFLYGNNNIKEKETMAGAINNYIS